jgi:hypothetical protein
MDTKYIIILDGQHKYVLFLFYLIKKIKLWIKEHLAQ